MKKFLRFAGFFLVILVVLYLAGPKPPKPLMTNDLPSTGTSIGNFDTYIKQMDAGLSIRPDNESRIFWANDSVHERTDYAVLYLHGFSASWYEGYPAHVNFSRHFGYNLFLPRLASHGEETDNPLIDMTPDRLWESAKEVLLAARVVGKKVIIMGTSTGGTLALKLAAEFPEYVDALILFSPNIKINNSAAFVLSKPWGLQVGRKFNGGKFRITQTDSTSADCKYWYCKYRMEGVVFLQQLVEETMKNETFSKVTVPVFLGYYYKDENNQDQTVRVDAMLKMFEQLATPEENKRKTAFPEAGGHVIACELTSGCYQEVTEKAIQFAEEVLGLKPLQ